MMQPTPVTPVIIKVVSAPTQEVSVVDVLTDALGLTGVLLVGSLVVGLIAGGVLIAFKRWRESADGGAATDGHAVRLDLGPPSR